jgi:hypothetical protein
MFHEEGVADEFQSASQHPKTRDSHLSLLVFQHAFTLPGASFVQRLEVKHFDIFDEQIPLCRIAETRIDARETSICLRITEENHSCLQARTKDGI